MKLRVFQRSQGFAVALAFFGVASVVSASGEPLKDWQNPKLTGIDNQPPHATMVICPDARDGQEIGAANSERVKSPFYRSLNGEWKYHYSANHTGRVPDFWQPDFDDQGLATIPVPSNVEFGLRHPDLRQYPVSLDVARREAESAGRAGG